MIMIVPGTIVVVDDKPKDAERDLVNPLRKKGERVILFERDSIDLTKIINLRLAILDWDLMDTNNLSLNINGPKVVEKIIKIHEHSKFCLIIIWSVLAGKDKDRIAIRMKIKEIIDSEMPSHQLDVDNIKIFKTKYKSDDLIKSIQEWINENHSAGLLLEWEKLVNVARDKVVSQIYDINIERIICKICEQYPMKSSETEISFLFSRMLSRHINLVGSKMYDHIIKIVEKYEDPKEEISKENDEEEEQESTITQNDLDWYSKFHYIQNYNYLSVTHPVMTGDLFFNPKEEDFKYYLVINPMCDFVQKKIDRIKFIKGCIIPRIVRYKRSDDWESIPKYVKDYCWTKYIKTPEGVKKELLSRSKAIENSLKGKLNNRFYPLLHIKNKPSESDSYHINLDFNNVNNIKVEISEELNVRIPEGWIRILRIDYPMLEDILQTYSTYCNRVGISEYKEYLNFEITKYKE